MMRYGSVCSGIEAATQAWRGLGWEAAFFSEIERFPSAVLAHHYGSNMPGEAPSANGVPNHGDMTKFQEWPDHAIDILVGGTPCQSFSVAGLRRGLADPRGNLALTYLAIAARYRPRWVVWENVPGVLSSGSGRDFGSFLGGLGQLGYGFAYRVLDAQFVRTCDKPGAVPQRRRRVFVVGYLGDWRRAAAVLFDRESLSGNPAPSREAGKAAPTIPSRSTGGGGLGTDFDCDGGLIPGIPDCSPALKARDHKGPSSDGDGDGAPILPWAIQERAVSENPDNGPQGAGVRDDGAAYTLEARAVSQAVAFDMRGREGGAMPEGPHDTANIRAASGGSSRSYVAFAQNTRDEVRLIGGDGQSVGALAAEPGMKQQAYVAGPQMAVRRLTPEECEALQGFPRNFTRIPYRGKSADECPDGPRYKALGNSMAVNVMGWIGERIQLVEARCARAAEPVVRAS